MQLSIILPVLNEAENLAETLEHLQPLRKQGHELIVIDGGSLDASLAIAHLMADQVLCTEKGRARQMNAGAKIASGKVLIFLHADTRLPETSMAIISSIFSARKNKRYLWGRFDVCLSGKKTIYRIIGFFINLRSRITSIATGDQAIFIETSLFHAIGGFPEIALMEDVAICKILRKMSSPVCLRQTVYTSSRRWEKQGVVATIWLMWKLRVLYFFGVPASTLEKMYD